MQETPYDPKNWATVSAAAAVSPYSDRHIRLLASRGTVTAQRIGRQWLIYLPSLGRYAPARAGWPAGKKRGVEAAR